MKPVVCRRYDRQPELPRHCNYYRDYDPSIGRYFESDPLGLRGGLNTFGYVAASPESGSDALGLATFPLPPPFPVPICGSGSPAPVPCRPFNPPPPQPSNGVCFAKCFVGGKGALFGAGLGAGAAAGNWLGKPGKWINACMKAPEWLPLTITTGLEYCTTICGFGSDFPNPVGPTKLEAY